MQSPLHTLTDTLVLIWTLSCISGRFARLNVFIYFHILGDMGHLAMLTYQHHGFKRMTIYVGILRNFRIYVRFG